MVARLQKATFGAGCFWGVEEQFKKLKGVVSTACGYAGGTLANPTYEQVCTDQTGHAEVVQMEYDPEQISYEELLNQFWKIHDPTSLNRQGPDSGRQYRSVIFFHDETQQAQALKSKEAQGRLFSKPIVTEIIPAPVFYRAEEYHQCYFSKQKAGGGKNICSTGN